jgi:2-polyprenyl-3-methyl-5-hydroxy-6-metoxy-1,4-benzoquinol methylase
MIFDFEKDISQKIYRIIKDDISSSVKILDVGSGSGWVASRIEKDQNISVTCIDVFDSF